jgi:hypothetical protein
LRLVAPDLTPIQAQLEQVGPGRYAGTVRADAPGAYLVRVAQTTDGGASASRTLGIVSPAAEEFRRLGVDPDALRELARAGGGRTFDPADPRALAGLWRHDIAAAAFPTPIWPWLLLLAILLVPLDIGVRRVALTRGDLRRAQGWVARRLGRGERAPEVVPGLAELRAATERRRGLTDRSARTDAPPRGAEPAPPPPPVGAGVIPPSAPADAARVPSRSPSPPAPAEQAAPRAAAEAEESLSARLARRRRGGD